MDTFEKNLKQLGALMRATEAKPEPAPPERVAALVAAIRAKAQQPRILTEPQMRLRILKVLSETPLDFSLLVKRLQEEKIALADEGDMFVYAILNKLEATGLLKARRNVNPTEIVTFYHVTDEGSKILQEDRSILATPATQPSK
jgi:DNA-binding PadR family transcriptional regulator